MKPNTGYGSTLAGWQEMCKVALFQPVCVFESAEKRNNGVMGCDVSVYGAEVVTTETEDRRHILLYPLV